MHLFLFLVTTMHTFTLLFIKSEKVCIAPGTKGVDVFLQGCVITSRSDCQIQKDVISVEKQFTLM